MKKYGWKPDLPDHRDLHFRAVHLAEVLESVDLRDNFKLPPIQDQGQIGSCTANGIASIVAFAILNKHTSLTSIVYPSRLFIYYNERAIEDTVDSDSGAEIRDGIKSVAAQGVCDESEWIYDTDKFLIKPPQPCYDDALKLRSLTYQRIDNTDKGALVAALDSGFPIVLGFSVYESFESDAVASTGVVPMPLFSEKMLGGHCVYMVGYDLQTDRFICANSWGPDWGANGFFTIPAAYLTNSNLADDFWIITSEG